MKLKNFKKSLFLGSAAVLIFLVLLSICTNSVQAARTLYFDSEGNLIFTAYGGKDTTGVRYLTIGWIIKRYDMPINAPGQRYIIVSKSGDVHSVPDPDNPMMLTTYVKSDKSEILSAVKKVSSDWEKQLVNYGGIVYIDTVFTIVQYGVVMGGINPDGSIYGEVYTDFEGISKARWWGDPSLFRQFYELSVNYPAQIVNEPVKYTTQSASSYTYSSKPQSSFNIGSNEKDNEIYNVEKGIPGGERLYLYGSTSSFIYDTKLTLVKGVIDIPVKISTTYILNWKDYNGISHSERQVVYRYYRVKRSYEYYSINSVNVLAASEAVVSSNGIIGGSKTINLNNNVTKEVKIYGDASKHISYTINTSLINGGTKTINSNNHLRPSIPDENDQVIAEKAVTAISVNSDRLSIGGNVVLSNAVGSGKGKSPVYFTPPKNSIYASGLIVNSTTQNGIYTSNAKVAYKNIATNVKTEVTSQVNVINILTPVVCEGGILCGKEWNQDVNVVDNTIVSGMNFTVSLGSMGFHSDNKGYGYQNYDKYLGAKYVKFPFIVERNNELIHENTWIDLSKGYVFSVPTDVKIGDYEVEYSFYAVNSKKLLGGGVDEINNQKNNADGKYHMATSKCVVHITGRLCGLTIDDKYTVGEKDVLEGLKNDKNDKNVGDNDKSENNKSENNENNKKSENSFLVPSISNVHKLSFTVVGNFKEEDKVDVEFTYNYIIEGNRYEVNVYNIEKRDVITKGQPLKAIEGISIPISNEEEMGKNIFTISKAVDFGEELYVFPKSVSIESIKDIISNRDKLLEGGSLVVNMKAYIIKDEQKYISYINSENSLNGYCNMWKKEGFSYEQMLNGKIENLKDGDAICLLGDSGKFYGYKVVGTH